MTKTEFRREDGKAGINSNLYGVTIDFPAVMVFCGTA